MLNDLAFLVLYCCFRPASPNAHTHSAVLQENRSPLHSTHALCVELDENNSCIIAISNVNQLNGNVIYGFLNTYCYMTYFKRRLLSLEH